MPHDVGRRPPRAAQDRPSGPGWRGRAALLGAALALGGAGACSGSVEGARGGRAPDGAQGAEAPGGSGGISGGGAPAPPGPGGSCAEAPPRRVVKLSDRQYARAVVDLLGPSVGDVGVRTPGGSPGAFLEPLETHAIGGALAAQYQRVAEEVARAVAKRPEPLLPCPPATRAADACVRSWIAGFAGRAFRRPLGPDELADYARLYEAGAADGAAEGAALVVEAILQAPSFLHRTELGAPGKLEGGLVPLTPHELAAQLSFWLLDSIPDPPLWEAAESGRLADPAVLGREVDRLLASSRARQTIGAGFLRWFGLPELEEARRDAKLFPGFADARASLVESARRAIDDALWAPGDALGRLFGDPEVYVDGKIGRLLGVPGASGAELRRMRLPDGQRAGIVTHPALMARFAMEADTQVVQRGAFVRRELLCQTLVPPPEGLEIEALGKGLDQRAFAAARAKEPTCAGCHALIDPFGLMFERFDPVGAYRERAGAEVIDTAGVVTGTDFDGRVAGPLELAARLAKSRQAAACTATHMATLALGRPVDPGSCAVARLQTELEAGGRDLPALLRAIALSPEFRLRKP